MDETGFTVADLEPWLLDYVPESGQLALDVGANQGAWTRHLTARFDEVHAFEPQALEGLSSLPENAKHVRVIVGATAGPLVELYLYERSWHASVFPGEDENSDRGATVGSITVPQVSLDSLSYAHKADEFINVDVEGYEVDVIRGAENLLQRRKPKLLIEIHNRGNGEWLEETLPIVGYELTRIPHPHLGAGPEHRWLYAE